MDVTGAVLLASSVYLMLHWDRVLRTGLFKIALGGLALMLAAGLLTCTRSVDILKLATFFRMAGLLVAFVGIVGSVFPEGWLFLDAPGPSPEQMAPPASQDEQ